MSESNQKASFLAGNIILGVCVVMLFYMSSLWQHLGAGAMILWMVLAGVGMFLVMTDKRESKLPD